MELVWCVVVFVQICILNVIRMHLSREIAEVVGGVLVSSQEKRLVRGVSRNKRKMARSEIKNRKGEKKLKRI